MECYYCILTFSTRPQLKKHERGHKLNTVNRKPPTIECRYCPKTFKVIAKRKNHERGHVLNRSIKCYRCNKRFLTEREINSHECF